MTAQHSTQTGHINEMAKEMKLKGLKPKRDTNFNNNDDQNKFNNQQLVDARTQIKKKNDQLNEKGDKIEELNLTIDRLKKNIKSIKDTESGKLKKKTEKVTDNKPKNVIFINKSKSIGSKGHDGSYSKNPRKRRKTGTKQ